MSTVDISWTESLPVASLHADPSGVQEASTTFQTYLFPGMSTLTARVRYISLFAAAKYHRMEAGLSEELPLSWLEYIRRFEALIAVSSILHHKQDNAPLDGIIGRNAGQKMSQRQEFDLKTDLHRPP